MAIIGIDLGTTTSESAIFKNGRPEMIKNEFSEDITPSIVALNDLKILTYGKAAKETWKDYAKEFKRQMGTDEKTKLGDKEFNAIELSSLLLKYIKQYSEHFLGEQVDRAVITVPANFTESQRNATIRAGEMAGFKVERIIHEPTAAALAFANKHPELDGKALVYDLGGGTFDVTILDYANEICDVIGSAGDTQLGGLDFDNILVNNVIKIMKEEDNVSLDLNDQSIDGLKRKRRIELETEKIKIKLSFQPQVNLEIPFFMLNNNMPYSLSKVVSRVKFENLIQDRIDRTFTCIEKALRNAKLSAGEIDFILLVGGSSRIPIVKERLISMFGANKVLSNLDPDRAVAMGACIQAAIIDSGKTGSEDVNTIILDVVPHSIGTKVVLEINNQLMDGFYSEIIPANSPMQKEFSDTFYTTNDNQEVVNVRVYQKASMNDSMYINDMEELAPDNPDDSVISGIPPAPAGEQSVTLTFSYNLNGTVDVKAKLDSTGRDIRFSAKKTHRIDTDESLVNDTWKKSEIARQVQIAQELINKRVNNLNPKQKQTLMDMLSMMQDAAAQNDHGKVNKIDDEINSYLFELS